MCSKAFDSEGHKIDSVIDSVINHFRMPGPRPIRYSLRVEEV